MKVPLKLFLSILFTLLVDFRSKGRDFLNRCRLFMFGKGTEIISLDFGPQFDQAIRIKDLLTGLRVLFDVLESVLIEVREGMVKKCHHFGMLE